MTTSPFETPPAAAPQDERSGQATIAETVRALREAKGLGQRALARAAELDHATISRLEGGKVADPGITVLQQLAGGLGCTVGQLLGERAPGLAQGGGRAEHESGGGGMASLPLDLIAPSPLNPRKTFDEADLAELAESIVAQGVLEPIIVREVSSSAAGRPGPTPAAGSPADAARVGRRRDASAAEEEPQYEIAVGERRWRAARLAGFTEIPAIVRELRDADLLEIAIVENQQRRDVPPLEEGEGYCALAKLDPKRYTPKAIADRIGRTDRYVQKRMKLARDLVPGAKELLAAGEINVYQAQVLMTAPPDRQAAALKHVEQGWIETAEDLRERLFDDLHPLNWAMFPRETYTGDVIEDADDPEAGWFADTAQAEKLQREAVEKLKGELEEKWAWVEVVPPNKYFSEWQYKKSKDRKEAGAVIDIRGDLSIKVHEGLVKPAPESSVGPSARQPPAARADGVGGAAVGEGGQAFTKSHLAYARNRKTEALQAAVAGLRPDPGYAEGFAEAREPPELVEGGVSKGPRTAMILACLALMGAGGNVHIEPIRHERDDAVLHPALAAAADAFADMLKGVHSGGAADARGPLRIGGASMYELPRPGDELKLYLALRAMPQPDLERLFALLVAARTGTFNGYRPELGDRPLAVQLAQDLDVKVGDHWRCDDDEYLKRARKPRLVEILAAATGADPAEIEKRTGGQLRARIKAEAARVVPREMLFGSEAELVKAKPVLGVGPFETPPAAAPQDEGRPGAEAESA